MEGRTNMKDSTNMKPPSSSRDSAFRLHKAGERCPNDSAHRERREEKGRKLLYQAFPFFELRPYVGLFGIPSYLIILNLVLCYLYIMLG